MSLILTTACAHATEVFDLKDQVEEYKVRYGLRDPYTKLIDNRGDGYEDLYGVRNLRVVLHGVYYRGGANNKYDRVSPRDNMNPLPNKGLNNLCQQGFSEAVYLYSENYDTAPKKTNCRLVNDNTTTALAYDQKNAFTAGNERILLEKIHNHIKGKVAGPIYAHCWNGWHASGFIAAAALKQFCGWSDAKAEDYWVRNTDGNLEGMEGVRRRVRTFQPYNDLKITAAERDLICP